MTPMQSLAYTLRCHPGDQWPIYCHLSRAVDIRDSDPIHRDDLYYEEVAKIKAKTTIRGQKLLALAETYQKPGQDRQLKEINVYPTTWYEWKCAKTDKRSFKIRLSYHPSDPRDQLRLAVLSHSTAPELHIARWRDQG